MENRHESLDRAGGAVYHLCQMKMMRGFLFVVALLLYFAPLSLASEHCHEDDAPAPVSQHHHPAAQEVAAVEEIPGGDVAFPQNDSCRHHPGQKCHCTHLMKAGCDSHSCAFGSATPFSEGVKERSAGQEETALLDIRNSPLPKTSLIHYGQRIPALADGFPVLDPRPPSA